MVYIENQQVLRRHINAYLVQRFFHETVSVAPDVYELFESLGTVDQFLSDEYPCSLRKLEDWLRLRRPQLEQELRNWAPCYSHGLQQAVPEVSQTIATSVDDLIQSLNEKLPVADYPKREELVGVVREGLERQLEEKLLDLLISQAVLPRYAFPTDVVSFWVSRWKTKGQPAYKREFDYEPQRDLQIALTEYAPGSSLTIDKFLFTSAALFSPYEPDVRSTLDRARHYTECRVCGYVCVDDAPNAFLSCPCCGSDDLGRQQFITPQGFSPDINERRQLDRGDAAITAGRTTRAQLEVQEPPPQWQQTLYSGRLAVAARAQFLVAVNKGVGDRGFVVCPNCARTEPVFGPGYPSSTMFRGGVPRQHKHPLEQGVQCDSKPLGPFYLGHRFPTDVLLLRLAFSPPVRCEVASTPGLSAKAGRSALTSLVEALCLAASQKLQIEEGEISGNWSPVLGLNSSEVYLFLYDLLPGGAGYTRLVGEALPEVLAETEQLLTGCTCETSCQQCLRHYANNFLHRALDRHLALAVLRFITTGAAPQLTEEQRSVSLTGLIDLLRLQGLRCDVRVEQDGLSIPAVIHRSDGSPIWVDVHHPLVDPNQAPSPVRDLADALMTEYCPIDAFTLQHDLPDAFNRLQL